MDFRGSPVRNLFNQFILSSPEGKLIIHATKKGELSYDTSDGGVFTKALIKVSTRVKAVDSYTSLSIKIIINQIAKLLQNQSYNQSPCIAYQTGDFMMPFAIGIPSAFEMRQERGARRIPFKFKSRRPRRVLPTSSINWEGIGLLSLGILIIASLD